MSSSETREVRTVNKDMEKMNEIGKNRRKCKNISNFHCDGETRAKIGRFVSTQTHSCTYIFSAIRITIVNR